MAIFTADDFGLSESVNEAVELAHEGGILTAASLMVGAPASADAVRRARRLPKLGVGLHVTVVNGVPVLPPESVPDLVDRKGRFTSRLVAAGVRSFFNRSVRRQLEAEITAQFDAFARTGLRLDHVDAQNHMHVHPTIFGMVLRIGRRYGLRAVRIPREPGGPLFLAPWLTLMRLRARRAGVMTNRTIFGLRDSGKMSVERVVRLLGRLRRGINEVYFHPATQGPDVVEFDALMSPAVREALVKREVVATTYGALLEERG
ncbi:MAG: hopanoid biosynthesis-associated protein HpnK [Candidatus Eremiobacteraeota bacterium]|nr:hopanoid biosynthesis-associated protein HpnK [Candidatus Eremiobacteraeota bacterium]